MTKFLLAALLFLIPISVSAQSMPDPSISLGTSASDLNLSTAAVTFRQGADPQNQFKALYTSPSGGKGSYCFSILANSNDHPTAHKVRFGVTYSGSTITSPIEIANIPAVSGGSATLSFGTAISAFLTWPAAISREGNTYIELMAGESISVAYDDTLSSQSQINVTANCGDRP